MNKIFAYLFGSLLIVGFSACIGESGELAEVATSDAASLNVPAGGSVIKNVTENVTFTVALTDKSDPALVQSVDVILNFIGVAGNVNNLTVTTLTSFPNDVSFTIAELLGQANLGIDELNAGDTWNYTYIINNNSGSTWSVLGTTRYTFTCPSAIAGEYTTVTTGQSTDGCCPDQVVDFPSTVTLVEERPGVYAISDFSAGLYFEWYDVYGVASTADTPGKIEHVCNNVNIIETTGVFNSTITGTGTIDEATGVITYSWSNGFGDTGLVVMTPK